jgi:hypothetical protein
MFSIGRSVDTSIRRPLTCAVDSGSAIIEFTLKNKANRKTITTKFLDIINGSSQKKEKEA